MFSFIRNLSLGFGSKSVDTTEVNDISGLKSSPVKVLSDEKLIKSAFNEEMNGEKNESSDSFEVTTDDNMTDDEDVEEEVDEDTEQWNQDWNAFEDKIDDNIHSHLGLCLDSVNGVVTQVINSQEIILDDNNRVKFTVSFNLIIN